jgi:cytochrome c556
MTTRFALAATALLFTLAADTSSAQTSTLKSIMREKADNAARLLRPLIAADFAELDRAAQRLSRVTYTEIASWQARADTAYLEQATAFVRSVQMLREGAQDRDIDRAASGYAGVVTACVQCHKQVRVMRTIGVN